MVYVDDIIITGNDSPFLNSLICWLNQQFPLKDLGTLSYVLVIQVTVTASALHLCPQKYIYNLLHRSSMVDCKLLSTRMASIASLSLYDCDVLSDPNLYRSIFDTLQYCILTHLNNSFAMNKVC